eukprot:11928427-Alexandrium_andersonii.AAC.1
MAAVRKRTQHSSTECLDCGYYCHRPWTRRRGLQLFGVSGRSPSFRPPELLVGQLACRCSTTIPSVATDTGPGSSGVPNAQARGRPSHSILRVQVGWSAEWLGSCGSPRVRRLVLPGGQL